MGFDLVEFNTKDLLFSKIARLEGFKVAFMYEYIPTSKYNDMGFIKGIYEVL